MINKIQPIKWRKLWEFHFPIWLLDRLIDTHIKFKERLGYENQDTLHIYSNTSEEAYFSEQELEKLKQERKNKLLSKEYMELHEEAALQAIENIKVIPNDLFEYSKLLEELLSFYRASRPEIFELIEDKTNQEYVKNLIKKYGELRFKLKEVWFNAEKRAEKLKQETAEKIGLELKQMENLTNNEIKSLINKELSKEKALELIKQRQKLCVFGIIQGKKFLVTGNQAEEIISLIKKDIKPTNKIIGKIASKGHVKGIVKIIPQTNYNEMIEKAKELKQGEILITGMTQPDIVFACKKASAIITDEGGITSHAAIISREFKIPCIIGTKIATKVFKDGDLVEVNANEGIVRLLNKT